MVSFEQLDALPKSRLVDIVRALGMSAGDYARTPKAAFIGLILSKDPAAVEQAMSAAPVATAPAVPAVAPQLLSPVAVARPAKIVARKPASEVFGIRGKALQGIEVDVWDDETAPEVDESYRLNPGQLRSFLTALNRDRPAWCYGPAGTGKTEFVKNVAARLGRAFIRVQFDAGIEAYHVIGGERVRGGSTVWQDGIVLQAMRRPGAIVLLDEVGFARSEYTSSLHAVLEPSGSVTIAETGEKVVKAPGVYFCAADNSNGRGDYSGAYVGVREINVAFCSRFGRFIEFGYPTRSEEVQIVMLRSGVSKPVAKLAVEFIALCRQKAKAAEIEIAPTLREAFYLAEALQDGVAPKDALAETIVNRAAS
ncbi:MAG: MoxR family ATPase, partial [Leucobacter sp.]